MFNKGDLVKIVTNNPVGVVHGVYGNIGVVRDVYNNDGEIEYTVIDEYRNTFIYVESELTPPSAEEIYELCGMLLQM